MIDFVFSSNRWLNLWKYQWAHGDCSRNLARSRPVFRIRVREFQEFDDLLISRYVPRFHQLILLEKTRVAHALSHSRSERGYRSQMAVTLGQGLGQSDSTYPVIAKSTRKKPTEDLYAGDAWALYGPLLSSHNSIINRNAPPYPKRPILFIQKLRLLYRALIN